ncbi:DUF3007 family protein [Synechococcus sp. PCC 6716]|nr:DUF3007 family protein [Synechococcus sp. PCC 6716]
MRRIDVLGIGVGVFFAGGFLYVVLRLLGLEPTQAGIWSQGIFVLGVIGWLATYLLRVFSGRMTYHQQLNDYEEAVLAQRLAELSPEELAALEKEIAAEAAHASDSDP